MRLAILEKGHSLVQKVQLRLMRVFTESVPGPVAAMSYRKEWFGRHFAACLQEAMRQATQWRVWETELFAASFCLL